MNWLTRAKQGIKTWTKKNLPDGLWEACPSCRTILYRKELTKRLSVCSKCGYHFRLPLASYLEIVPDAGTFRETETALASADPLGFVDTKRYVDRLAEAAGRTGRPAAIVTGRALLGERAVALAVMDFDFLGGSMDSVVGEKFTRLASLAVAERVPLIAVVASGGARMQESVLSLMQMAKTSAASARMRAAAIPFITVLTNPTTGGVAASFAFQGDIIIGEPGATIGFAGPRVIRETVGEKLPEGFQRAEFLLEHGMIDMIVGRADLRRTLVFLVESLMPEARPKRREQAAEHVKATVPVSS